MTHRRDDNYPSHPGRPAGHGAAQRVPEHMATLSLGTIAEPGVLLDAARIQDGGQRRALARGRVGGTARNGDAVVFPQPFSGPPMVLLRGGVSYEPRSKWNATGDGTGSAAPLATAQYEDMAALNLDATGFTLRARLRQKGTATAVSNLFPAGTITAVGQSIAVTLASAPATNDTYTASYSLTLTATGADFQAVSVDATVAIDSSADSGATWTERAQKFYSTSGTTQASQSWTDSQQIVVSGLDNTDQIRVRLKSLTGDSPTASLDPDDVAYTTSGTDQYASKTPDTDDGIAWEAIAVA